MGQKGQEERGSKRRKEMRLSEIKGEEEEKTGLHQRGFVGVKPGLKGRQESE